MWKVAINLQWIWRYVQMQIVGFFENVAGDPSIFAESSIRLVAWICSLIDFLTSFAGRHCFNKTLYILCNRSHLLHLSFDSRISLPLTKWNWLGLFSFPIRGIPRWSFIDFFDTLCARLSPSTSYFVVEANDSVNAFEARHRIYLKSLKHYGRVAVWPHKKNPHSKVHRATMWAWQHTLCTNFVYVLYYWYWRIGCVCGHTVVPFPHAMGL